MTIKKVLVVEDQLEFLAIQASYLRHHGYTVVTAGDGEAALRVARDELPDLILMDCTLPRLDGLAATARLRQDLSTQSIPVVLLTALSYGAVGRRARQAGCNGYLPKPCDPRRVLQEVQRWIGRGEETL